MHDADLNRKLIEWFFSQGEPYTIDINSILYNAFEQYFPFNLAVLGGDGRIWGEESPGASA